MNHKILTSVVLAAGSAIFLPTCTPVNNDSADTADTVAIAKGEAIFHQTCVSCHSMDQDGIGPALGGITAEVSREWLSDFIRNPKKMIDSGDDRAVDLFRQYKSVMPAFGHYGPEDINGIIAYLATHKASVKKMVAAGDAAPLKDPIPERIPFSDLVVELELLIQMPATSDEKPRTRITKFCSRPDAKDLYVLDLRGKLYRLKDGKPEIYLDMSRLKPGFISTPGHATGFGSFAFHPAFEKNGLMYTTHTEAAGSRAADFFYEDSLGVKLQWVLSEWKTDQPGAFPFNGTPRELLRINMVGQSHGVQEITFNPLASPNDEDYGLLYVGIGDGGSAERGILHINKGPENPWSSIIRIDPAGRNSRNGKYGIPEGNPFVHSTNPRALAEVYAYGFRNPHRISWTRAGQMVSSNIGQHNIEELNLILPGHDYGWPTREGSFIIDLRTDTRRLYPLPPGDDRFQLDYPIAEYDHDEGNAIIGGYEYSGLSAPALKGKYLFGDMMNGRMFCIDVADIREDAAAPIREVSISLDGRETTFRNLCDDERLSMRFGQDYRGEILVSTMPDGKIYRVTGAHRRLSTANNN